MSCSGSMVSVSQFRSHNLVPISRTHPGGIHTEYHGHGQPGLQHGCPGDIYINTDPKKLEVFARLVDSWVPWKGPLYRNDFIYHPTNNELSLWCLRRTGPNWCRSSRRYTEYDASLGDCNFEAAFCISEYLKHFQVQTESGLQSQKITHSHNNDQVQYNSVGPTDSLSFPRVRIPRTFQVSNITNSYYYRADSNGVYTVPFSHFWSTSCPAPQTGNLGDFFFVLSPKRHQIFIKLQDWVEWPGLNIQEPRLVRHPGLNDVVAWIDESQATWVSTSNFMAWCEALRQTQVPYVFMSADQCVTHLLPKLPDALSVKKSDVELLRSRNLDLSVAHAKLLKEVSYSSQVQPQALSDRSAPQSNVLSSSTIASSPQYSSSAVQTECMLYCDRGCSPVQGAEESPDHRKNSLIVASAHAVSPLMDDHSCTTTSQSESAVSTAADSRDPCVIQTTVSSTELQDVHDYIDDLDTPVNPSSPRVDVSSTEEETCLASLSEPCAIEVLAVQECSLSGNKTVDPSSSSSAAESTLVDNDAIQTQNVQTLESVSCERYQSSTPLSDSNSVADSYNKIKRDEVLLLLSSDLNFSSTTSIVDCLLSIMFHENQICRLCLQLDPPQVVEYSSSIDRHDLLLHCNEKHTTILQILLSLSHEELIDICDRLSAI